MTALADELAARIRAGGPLGFDEVVEAALYHPDHGFFSRGGGAGRRGDFITSPEVGPLFGAVVARALDRWWRQLGRPRTYTVVEAGAGRGALALAVRAARPECLPALRYVLVERSPALRAAQGEHLPLDGPDPSGATFTSLPELPRGRFAGVVLANELLDNLPFGLLQRRGAGWCEVRVGLGPDGRTLVEELVPSRGAVPGPEPGLLDVGRTEGDRVPVQVAAARWVAGALARLTVGRLVAFDYAATTAELAARPQASWLRTYRGHERGAGPLDDLGHQDVTCEVCLDQVAAGGTPTTVSTQADWLRHHGIDELVAEGRRAWEAGAAAGGLAALAGRSRVREAEALLDPGGLGGFAVVEWAVP